MSLNFLRVIDAETKLGVATAKVEAKGIVLAPPSTDPQGNVILFSLPLLSYHIKVSKDGYLSAESDITPSGPIHAAELIMQKLPTGLPTLPERPREWIPPITPPEIYHPPEEVAPAPAPAPTPPQLYYPPAPTPTPPEEIVPTPPEVIPPTPPAPTPTYQLYVSSSPIFVVVTYE